MQRFTELCVLVEQGQATRPYLYAHQKAREMSRIGRTLVDEYLDALRAPAPILAQDHANRAQECLGELERAAEDLTGWLQRAEELDNASTAGEMLSAMLQDAMSQTGSQDLLQLDEIYRRNVQETLGADVEPGAAIPYATCSSLAAIYLDDTRFHSVVKQCSELYLRNAGAVRRLLEDSEFCRDLNRIELELFDSAATCHAVLSGTSLVRQATRAVVELHASLVESAGLIVAASVLLATGRKRAAYRSLKRLNATELLRIAQSEQELGPLLLGLDDHLRTAFAHRAITYHEDGISTNLRSGRRHISLDTLVDETYTAMESLLATLVAIRLAASALDSTIQDEIRLRELGMSPPEILRFMLNAFGHRCLSCKQENHTLVAELDAENAFGITPAIGTTVTHLPADVEWSVRIDLPRQEGLLCPLQPYAAFRLAQDEFSKELSVMRIQAAWKRESGDAHLRTEVLRKWTAAKVAAFQDLDLGLYIRRLRHLRQLALDFGDNDLAQALSGAIRVRRLQECGDTTGVIERAAVQHLLEWLRDDVDLVFI